MSRPLLSKEQQKKIALERLKILFNEAEEVFHKDQALANRYVTLARKIAMRVKLTIPLEIKRKFCKHCYKFLKHGVNARVRTRNGKVVISCLQCKNFMRIPIKNNIKNNKN